MTQRLSSKDDLSTGLTAYLQEMKDFDYKNEDLKGKIRLTDLSFKDSLRKNSKKRDLQTELQDTDPSHSDTCGRSLLHKAVVERDTELVRHLIQEGADVHALDCVGNAPLHLACNPPNYEIAKLLCDAGANPMQCFTKECKQSPYTIIKGQQRRYACLAGCTNEHSKLSLEKFKRLLHSSQMILEMFSRWRDSTNEREVTDRGLSGLLGEVDMLGLLESERSRKSIQHELTDKVSCIEIAPSSFSEWRQTEIEIEPLVVVHESPLVRPIEDALNSSLGSISLNATPLVFPQDLNHILYR